MQTSAKPSSAPPLRRPKSFLLDTNVLIPAEQHLEVSESISRFYRMAADYNVALRIHESSLDDLNRDKHEERRQRTLSRLSKYATTLAKVPLDDAERVKLYGNIGKDNDRVDTDLLHTVALNTVEYLITEDDGLHARARSVGLDGRVLYLSDALRLLMHFFEPALVNYPKVYASDCEKEKLNHNHTFFNSLKADYDPKIFVDWLGRCIQMRRKCFIIRGDTGPLGLIIHKPENRGDAKIFRELEAMGVPGFHVMKICLFRLEDEIKGEKYGEQILKAAMDYGFQHDFDTLYLTVYPKHKPLVSLISKFGFVKVGVKGEEFVYAKLMRPDDNVGLKGFDFHKAYWPRIDEREVRHFAIPIQPQFHERLFPEVIGPQEQPLQLSLALPEPKVRVDPGNAIRKVYVCGANLNDLPAGSVLWFYRSQDGALVSVGVVESYEAPKTFEELRFLVGQRSVYENAELEERMTGKNVKVLNFYYAFHLKEPPPRLAELIKLGILKTAPQTIGEIKQPASHALMTYIRQEHKKYFYNGFSESK